MITTKATYNDTDSPFARRPYVSPARGHDFVPGGRIVSVYRTVDPATVCRVCLLGAPAHDEERSGTDTQLMPALRLLPPVRPDRRTGWKLTRRGHIVAQGFAGAAILGLAIAADPIAHAVVQFTVNVGQIVGAL